MEVAHSTAARRRIKNTTNYTVIALIVLGILAVLNFFFYRHFGRIDLTHDKRYTLTPSSRQALAGLDDIVNIKLYVSQKLPSYLVNLKRDITDLSTNTRRTAGATLPCPRSIPPRTPRCSRSSGSWAFPRCSSTS